MTIPDKPNSRYITVRGLERRAIFYDARDRGHFSELLEEMVDDMRGDCGVIISCIVLSE